MRRLVSFLVILTNLVGPSARGLCRDLYVPDRIQFQRLQAINAEALEEKDEKKQEIDPDCQRNITEGDKMILKNFAGEIAKMGTLPESAQREKVKALLDMFVSHLTPAGKIALVSKLTEGRLRNLAVTLNDPDMKFALVSYENATLNFGEFQLKENGADDHTLEGDPSSNVRFQQYANGVIRAEKRLLQIVDARTDLSETQKLEFRRAVLQNEQALVDGVRFGINTEIQGIETKQAAVKGVLISALAGGLFVGAGIVAGIGVGAGATGAAATGGAVASGAGAAGAAATGAAAQTAAAAHAAWALTLAHFGKTAVVGAMGFSGVVGLFRMGQPTFSAAVDGISKGGNFVDAFTCSYGAQIHATGDEILNEFVGNAILGAGIAVGVEAIGLAVPNALVFAKVPAGAAKLIAAKGAKLVETGINAYWVWESAHDYKERQHRAQELWTLADKASAKGDTETSDWLYAQAQRLDAESRVVALEAAEWAMDTGHSARELVPEGAVKKVTEGAVKRVKSLVSPKGNK